MAVPAKYEAAVATLEAILRHRRARPTIATEELYYRLLYDYHRRALEASREGRPLVGYGLMIPNEILYAFDAVPFHLEMGSAMLVPVLRNYEEAFTLAKSFGLPPELCSAHRTMAAVHVAGWVPRPDAVVWTASTCDSCAKSGELMHSIWKVPVFFLDFPYSSGDRELEYLARELEEMADFLSQALRRKPDPERLREAIEISARTAEVQRRIYELGKAKPFPGLNRYINQFLIINWLYGGFPQGLEFSLAVLKEMEARAEEGSYPYEERFRLLSATSPPPAYNWKLMDWLQRERGVSLVAAPVTLAPHRWEADLSRPFLSLARRCYAEPHCHVQHGPIEPWLDLLAEAPREFDAQGALLWASAGCRQIGGALRAVADTLKERAGVPVLTLDMEVIDPTYVSEEEIKERLDGFLETLESRR